MPGDLLPEDVLDQLEKGQLSSVYLFYGQSEFRLEKVLNRIRETFIPEEARDLNLQIFYGDDTGISPGEIADAARSFPFMSQNRLIIVRRTESFPGTALETFIPYLDEPLESSCLIFISSKPDFRKKFYKKIRDIGRSVNFKKLYDKQVVPWIRKMAKDLGINIEPQACAYLQQIVGNQLRDLHSELEKIYLYYGKTTVGLDEVKKLAIYSRSYTVFELMDKVSFKRRAEAISTLNRFLEEEGKDSALGVLGMFVRQFRLLRQAKSVMERGGRMSDLIRKLGVHDFVAKKIEQQSRHWSTDELERGFRLLYQADGLLKSGSQGKIVLENVVLSLCV